MSQIIYDATFDWFDSDKRSKVFQIFPTVFGDNRGFFTEILKTKTNVAGSDSFSNWIYDFSWIKQVNRSSSKQMTVRGCHAQTSAACQGKLVSALNFKIYDIITDARPDSKTFGVTMAYLLDPAKQNLLWVPRGFLHSFAVPKCSGNALFEYFCDNTYNKTFETGVDPMTIIPDFIEKAISDAAGAEYFSGLIDMFNSQCNLELSKKDLNSASWNAWSERVLTEYSETGKVWYN